MKSIEDLKVDVTAMTTVSASAAALLAGLKAKIDALKTPTTDPATAREIDMLAGQVESNIAALSAAITANTPADTSNLSDPVEVSGGNPNGTQIGSGSPGPTNSDPGTAGSDTGSGAAETGTGEGTGGTGGAADDAGTGGGTGDATGGGAEGGAAGAGSSGTGDAGAGTGSGEQV